MPGIDQVISDRMNAFAGQPEALAQRYAQNQDLLDLLALQKLKTDKTAAMREVQASMQANPTTVRDQLEQEALTQTRQEMATQATQGAQGMQLNQRRAMAARGIPSLPAPNMARMRGYQQGGIVPTAPKPKPTMGAVPPSAVGDEQIKQFAKEYTAIKRSLEDPRQAEFKERNQMLLQDLIRQMGNQMPAVMQYIDSTKGMVEPRGFQEGGDVAESGDVVTDALSYLAERGVDAAQYTAEQLIALGRQLQASGNRPSIEAMGAREAQLESQRRGFASGEGSQQLISGVERAVDRAVDLKQQLAEREQRQRDLPSVADEQSNVLSQVLSGSTQVVGDRMPDLNIVERMADIGRNMPGMDLGQSPRLQLPRQTPTGGVSTGGRSGRARELDREPPTGLPEFLSSGEYNPGGRRERREGADEENGGIAQLLLGEPGGPGVPPSRRRMALEALWQGLTAPSEAVNDVVNQISAGRTPPQTAPTQTAPTQTAPVPEPPAGLEALVDRTTDMREPFRMEGTEPSGMRTPQDYLASLARQQTRQRAEQPETAAQPVSRYQEELDRLRAQEEDPMRALGTFLTGMGSGRGRGLGRSLATGAQALNAAKRDIDARRLQLVEALQNEEITAAEAARENRRLDLMGEDIEVQREYNEQRLALEERVERLRAQGRLQEARAALTQGATELFASRLEQAETREEVENSAAARGLSEAEINELVQRRTQEKIQDYIRGTAESSGLNALATATSGTFGADEFAEEMTITE